MLKTRITHCAHKCLLIIFQLTPIGGSEWSSPRLSLSTKEWGWTLNPSDFEQLVLTAEVLLCCSRCYCQDLGSTRSLQWARTGRGLLLGLLMASKAIISLSAIIMVLRGICVLCTFPACTMFSSCYANTILNLAMPICINILVSYS